MMRKFARGAFTVGITLLLVFTLMLAGAWVFGELEWISFHPLLPFAIAAALVTLSIAGKEEP